MPTEVSYLNPASLLPPNDFKASGPLGGVMWAQQADDYRQLMEVQKFLQQIGAQRAQQEQTEFMQGAPVRSQERANKMETLQGENPYLRDVAGATAQNTIAGKNYETNTRYSGSAQEQFFKDLKQKSSDQQWELHKRSLSTGADIAQNAHQIADYQGEAAAMGYIQQQVARGKQMGLDLPEKQLLDPNGRKGILNAARYSVEQMQKIDQQAQKDNASMDRTKVTAGATVEAANLRARAAASLNKPPKNDKEALARYREIVSDPDISSDQREQAQRLYKMTVDSLWNETLKGRYDLQSAMSDARSPDKARAERGRRAMEEAYQQFLHNLGVDKMDSPTTTGSNTAPMGKPEDAGERVLVTDPQGRKGYIPKSQLEAARRQGYRETK